MTQTLTRYDGYAADFDALNGGAQPQWLRDLRSAAWERFLRAGFPTARRGNEPYKYTNVAPIANADLRLAPIAGSDIGVQDLDGIAPAKADWARMVFVDGHYSEALSSMPPAAEGVSVSSLADAVSADDSSVAEHLAQYADVDEDGFIALNTAFIRDGAVVRIDADAKPQTPLHLVFVSDGAGEQTVSHPRALVVAGSGSSATLIESYIGIRDNRCLTNAVTEIALGEGAQIDHYRLLMESESAYHIGVARVRQAANSVYNSKVFERQVGLGRFDLYTSLDGPESACDLKGLYFTSGSQHMDNYKIGRAHV